MTAKKRGLGNLHAPFNIVENNYLVDKNKHLVRNFPHPKNKRLAGIFTGVISVLIDTATDTAGRVQQNSYTKWAKINVKWAKRELSCTSYKTSEPGRRRSGCQQHGWVAWKEDRKA